MKSSPVADCRETIPGVILIVGSGLASAGRSTTRVGPTTRTKMREQSGNVYENKRQRQKVDAPSSRGVENSGLPAGSRATGGWLLNLSTSELLNPKLDERTGNVYENKRR